MLYLSVVLLLGVRADGLRRTSTRRQQSLSTEYVELPSSLPIACDGSSEELPDKWNQGACARGAADGRWMACDKCPGTFHCCEEKVNAWSGDHLAWEPQAAPSGSLVVFLPGTGGSPSGYKRLQRSASKAGHHVIGLTYQSQPFATQMSNDWCDPCAPGRPRYSASDCNIEIHQQMCFGDETVNATYRGGSNDVWPVKREHSIEALLEGALSQLAWGEDFLKEDSFGAGVLWDKVIISGHSQGASHAAYLSQAKGVRAVLFSGPQETWDSAKEWISWRVPDGIVRRAFHHAYEECAAEAGGGTWGILPGSYCPPNVLPTLLGQMDLGEVSEWTGASVPEDLGHVISRVEPADVCKPSIPPGTARRIYHIITAMDFGGCTHESTDIIWQAMFTGM